jgi:hypothetical protein
MPAHSLNRGLLDTVAGFTNNPEQKIKIKKSSGL